MNVVQGKKSLPRRLQQHIKLSRIAANASKAKGNRHIEILSTLYKDKTRFIEELLQNTEDAYRKLKFRHGSVLFTLTNDTLCIGHNGKPFDENDLIAITTIGKTTKQGLNDVNLIGKFGLGFKSVFSICNEPEIHSGKFNFKICDFEVLEHVNPILNQAFSTTFRFPLIDEPNIFQIVEDGLHSCSFEKLLFLSALTEIQIVTPHKQIIIQKKLKQRLSKELFLVQIEHREKASTIYDFLVYTPTDKNHQKENTLSFAFPIQRADEHAQTVFNSITQQPVYVYFPTSELSGLPFPVHAGFTTTPTREHIPFEKHTAPENIQLLENISKAFSQLPSLLKKCSMLNESFFRIMPVFSIREAGEHPVRKHIREGLLKAMEHESILPSDDDKWYTASELVFPLSAEIQNLTKKKDIETFFLRKAFVSRALLTGIPKEDLYNISWTKKIRILDDEDFGFVLGQHPSFFENRPISWHVVLFRYLAARPFLWNEEKSGAYYNIRHKPFLLCNDSVIRAPYIQDKVCIALHGTHSGKAHSVHKQFLKNPEALSFFSMLGLKHESSQELILHTLLSKLTFTETPANFFQLWKKILSLYQKLEHEEKKMFQKILATYQCLPCTNSNNSQIKSGLFAPENVYFPTDDITNCFSHLPHSFNLLNKDFIKKVLSFFPSETEWMELLNKAGVRFFPAIVKTQTCDNHLLQQCLTDFKASGLTVVRVSVVNFDMEGLDDILAYITPVRSAALCKLFQDMQLHDSKAEIIIESYTQSKAFEFTPTFIEKLQTALWLFDETGNAFSMQEIRNKELHPVYKIHGITLEKIAGLTHPKNNVNMLSADEQEWLSLFRRGMNFSDAHALMTNKFSAILEKSLETTEQKPILIQLSTGGNVAPDEQPFTPSAPLHTPQSMLQVFERDSLYNEKRSFAQLLQNKKARALVVAMLSERFSGQEEIYVTTDSQTGEIFVEKHGQCIILAFVSAIKSVSGNFVFTNKIPVESNPDLYYFAVEQPFEPVPVIYELQVNENHNNIFIPFIYVQI